MQIPGTIRLGRRAPASGPHGRGGPVARRACAMAVLLLAVVGGCGGGESQPAPPVERETLIPPEQAKVTPGTDAYPPRAHSTEYSEPVPLPYPLNTSGAEDSAFVLPDGKTLYVWFTPDPRKPPEQQVSDGVTGIYVSRKEGKAWSKPERVVLQDRGKLALDGCEFVLGDRMWFCSAREGFTGVHWFTADYRDGRWQGWESAGFDPAYEVGELHITASGMEMYFHSPRPGGQGGYDIWVSRKSGDSWGPPENVAAVNSAATDGWPFVTEDGLELWFTRTAGAPELCRSRRVDGEWGTPEKMFSNFAGEASLDREGNVYFTHHFFKDGVMLEADIYIAAKAGK